MNEHLESHLTAALKRLEKAAEELMRSRGVTHETEALKVLTELVKEQVQDENPRHSNRQAG